MKTGPGAGCWKNKVCGWRPANAISIPSRIADLRVAGDLRVTGMEHVYYTRGLGVPLVAHRLTSGSEAGDVQDRFLPHELQTGATGVMMPSGGLAGGQWRSGACGTRSVRPVRGAIAGRGKSEDRAGQRSHDAAGRAGRPRTPGHAGMARAFRIRLQTARLRERALYAASVRAGQDSRGLRARTILQPQGLDADDQRARNAPELDARFQYWMFIYPTGLPIPASAARLRDSLVDVRETLDPAHADRALDRMVLVGHSMGGVLSKMMVQDSGCVLWDAAITVPRDEFKGPPELKSSLDHVLVYQPLPFVRRVVFVATPHRGSPIANSLFGRTISDLVRRPVALASRLKEIERLNGPNVISRELRSQPFNAIGNLRTNSPILAALDLIPLSPEVPYHSIIPLIGGKKGSSDGVVEYRSSHLDRAASERIVAGTHSSQEDPQVTRELRRILLEHLATADPSVIHTGGP